MLKEIIKYEDYNGITHEKEYYFNLSKPELGRLEFKYKKGLEAEMKRMADEDDRSGMMDFLENIIISSYGVKSEDGEEFVKDPDATRKFANSAAYSELYGKLFTDEKVLEAFIRGILPPGEVMAPQNNPIPAPPIK